MSTSPASMAPPATQLEGSKRWEVLAAVMAVMFFSSMASTVVSTALPNIVSDLHGLSLYAWVFTAFILGSAIVIPVYGTLSDVFGRKPLYVVAIGLYAVGNLVAGFSQNMEMLVAARGLSGLGGGGMMALSQITIGDIFTPQERGRWMGLMMSAFGLASIVGPTLGGWITDTVGWRWVFWFNIPISLVPLAALLYALPSVRRPGKVRIDFPGIAALVVGLMPILLAITWLGEHYAWSDPRVAWSMVGGLAVLAFFIWWEFQAEAPLIRPSFFSNRIFVAAMLASFCLALGMYGSIMFTPLFVQGVVGTSAKDSGVVLAPMMVGFVVGSFVSGQLVSRFGRYRVLAVLGLVISCVGMYLFGLMDVHTSNLVVVRNMIVLGIGIGGTMPLFTIAVQNAFPYEVMGAVTGVRQFFTSLGGAIGVPIMGALLDSNFQGAFNHRLTPQLAALVRRSGGHVDPSAIISAEAQAAIHAQFMKVGANGAALYQQFIFAVRDGLAVSIQSLFHLGLGFMVAALVVSLFLKEIPLRAHHVEPRATAEGPKDEARGRELPVPAPEGAASGRASAGQ